MSDEICLCDYGPHPYRKKNVFLSLLPWWDEYLKCPECGREVEL